MVNILTIGYVNGGDMVKSMAVRAVVERNVKLQRAVCFDVYYINFIFVNYLFRLNIGNFVLMLLISILSPSLSQAHSNRNKGAVTVAMRLSANIIRFIFYYL